MASSSKESEDKRLKESIDRLNNLMERRLSVWRNFLIGIVRGIGSIIGATVIGGIVVGVIASNLDRLPIINRLIDIERLQDYIEQED
jgi:hypothetical protein